MALQTNLPTTARIRLESNGEETYPIRILLIEQHRRVRQALVTRLRSSPLVEVVTTTTLEQAVTQVQNAPQPDVVLLGLPCSAPGGFGVVIKSVRQMLAMDQVVIVLASYASDEEREALMNAGINRYLLKNINTPVLLDEIMNAVHQV